MRILSLGDSYTIGEAVAESDRWPVQLAELLRAGGKRVDELIVVAQTGWTTEELDAGMDAKSPSGAFDLVTLLVGVNDQYRGRSVEAYREQFRRLLGRAIAFAGGRAENVVVLSIPDWGVTPFAATRDRAAIASEIDAFNAAARAEVEQAGAQWVDVTGISRRAVSDHSLLASDGLHPSAAMYSAWARLVFEVVS